MTNRIVILGTLLLAFGLTTNWLLEETERPAPDGPGNEPDLYMLNASISQFDSKGELRHTVSATRFTHFPLTDLTTMIAPTIDLGRDGSEKAWKISSNEGRLLPSSAYREEVIELWSNVLASRTGNGEILVEIKTDSLTVYPERQFAETDNRVSIINPSGRTSAAGMRAFFDSGRYYLYSGSSERVTTIFQPNT